MTAHAIRLSLVLLLGMIWFSWNAQQVDACTCPLFTPAESLEYSDAVFKGRVTAIHYSEVPDDQRKTGVDTVVAFEVNSVWKGPLYHTTYVATNRYEASCGFEFDYGEEYLVYVKDGETGWCAGTTHMRYAQEHLAVLGLSFLPAFGTSQRFPYIPGVVNPLWTATPTPTPQPTPTPTPEPTATVTPYPTATPTPELQQDISSNVSGCNIPSQLRSSGTDVTWLGVMAALVWFGAQRRKP